MMAWPTIICGVLLILDGVIGYFQQESANPSPTALIPAVFGGVLVVCGLLAFKDNFRKHVMHLAAMVGLVGAVGGFFPLYSQYKKTGSFDPSTVKSLSGEFMILICAIFVGLCVKSFIDARKAREAKAASAGLS